MKTGLKMTEELADLPVLDGTDFDYPEHTPQWIPAGSARICGVCGGLDMPAEPASSCAAVRGWTTDRAAVQAGSGS